MVKKIELCDGSFYECRAYLRDSESGLECTRTLDVSSKFGLHKLPIYAICKNGLIREIVTGSVLSYSPTDTDYYSCSYEKLKGLSDSFLNIEYLSEVSKMEVAAFLKDIESDGLVYEYTKALEKARKEQQREIKYSLSQKEPVFISTDETEKIISKYLSRYK